MVTQGTIFWIYPDGDALGAVNGDARTWADETWDTYGFDYDTERTGGQIVCAWPLDDGPDVNDDLREALRVAGIHYTTEIVDLDQFFGLETT